LYSLIYHLAFPLRWSVERRAAFRTGEGIFIDKENCVPELNKHPLVSFRFLASGYRTAPATLPTTGRKS